MKNLYLYNNSDGGKNGFIPVSGEEKKILINLYELIRLLQNHDGILDEIVLNQRLFLISIIPFIRGYAHICSDADDIYGQLSELMHGYTNACLDIAEIYERLFRYHFDSQEITTQDILSLDCSDLRIIDDARFPLLSETLNQTATYYHLRMLVEYELADIYNVNTERNYMLTQIIRKAFATDRNASEEEIDLARNNKVFFTSRKTLINEFNHFEGNMNIFQPAIDITPQSLQKEVREIETRLRELRAAQQ